jgi:hypothetical protein
MADDFVICGRCEEITHRGWSKQCNECDKIFCNNCEICDKDDDGCDKHMSITELKFERLDKRLHRYINEIYRLRNKYNDNDFCFTDYESEFSDDESEFSDDESKFNDDKL